MCVQNSIFGQEWLDACICKTEKPIKQAVVVSHLYPPNLICKVCASSSVIKVLQAVASGHNLATLIDTEALILMAYPFTWQSCAIPHVFYYLLLSLVVVLSSLVSV